MSTGFVTPNTPNLADFLTFLATVNIPIAALPVDSPWPGYAFDQAVALTLCPPCAPGILYTLAVYNCATHLLFAIAPDQTDQTFFANARSAQGFNLIAPAVGIVTASSDEATSTTLTAPKWADGLTVAQLGFMATPWGREYLAWAQSYGPSIVGLT